MRSLLAALPILGLLGFLHPALGLQLGDAYPDKARFAPSEPVHVMVELAGAPSGGEQLSASIAQLGRTVGQCGSIQLKPDSSRTQALACTVPDKDFQGYLVAVRLADAKGAILGERETAIDISSDWKRFPRYGYLAHYNVREGADPPAWIAELNRFHINGLEFYDFQFRHDQPLAGTVAHPDASWKDIAGRPVDAAIVRGFIDQAHQYNMMAMAYNSSYSAYDDVFTNRKDQLPLKWAIWTTPDGPRTAATAKNLQLQNTNGWSTNRLYYMNQNDGEWQKHLFGQMHNLFEVYPFDGWHVDTFGDKGGYAFDGAPVDFISGFRNFIDNAHDTLHTRIVFNAVATQGQERIARSTAEFVYSELWEDNETFAGILTATEQVHFANPRDGFVIAAYLHKEPETSPIPEGKEFNMPSVLLTDAAIFANSAAHIELGDGNRMLNREYFPKDTRLSVSPELHLALRHYYDFLTAYENYLRDDVSFEPCDVHVKIANQVTNPVAVPNTIWTLARVKDDVTIVHLINLIGSNDPHWRDVWMKRPAPPELQDLNVAISSAKPIESVGWASPDVDGGKFHSIPFRVRKDEKTSWIEFTVPSLEYWDSIFLAAPQSPAESAH
jgi:dextranase